MDTFDELSKQDQNLVFAALELLGDDYDAAWSHLNDFGIEIDFDSLVEISEHFDFV